MRVFYQFKDYYLDFPKDARFFRLTRKYYPNQLVEITKEGQSLAVTLKELKIEDEVRSGKFNEHHMTAKSDGGETIMSNMLRMDISRHNCYHNLFHNLSIRQAGDLLHRVADIKEAKRLRIKL